MLNYILLKKKKKNRPKQLFLVAGRRDFAPFSLVRIALPFSHALHLAIAKESLPFSVCNYRCLSGVCESIVRLQLSEGMWIRCILQSTWETQWKVSGSNLKLRYAWLITQALAMTGILLGLMPSLARSVSSAWEDG